MIMNEVGAGKLWTPYKNRELTHRTVALPGVLS